MADAENCKPQAKDGWTDAAGVTVKEGKSGSNRDGNRGKGCRAVGRWSDTRRHQNRSDEIQVTKHRQRRTQAEKRGQRDAGWRKTGSSPQAHRTEKQDNRR